jgi:hypothetical protein
MLGIADLAIDIAFLERVLVSQDAEGLPVSREMG